MTAPLDLAAILADVVRSAQGRCSSPLCPSQHEGDAPDCIAAAIDRALEAAQADNERLTKAVIAWLETNHYGEQIAAERRIRAIVYPGSFAADRATGAEVERPWTPEDDGDLVDRIEPDR